MTPRWNNERSAGSNDRLPVGEGRAPDFDEAFGLALASSSRTYRRSATRRCERLADWSVRSQDFGTPPLRTMSAVAHGASFVPDSSGAGSTST